MYAATPAGTLISNKAIASYRSSPAATYTNRYISNTNILTVTNLSFIIISPTNTGSVQEGQTITFSHKVSNYGNMSNTVQIIATNITGYTLKVYSDTNENGVLDPAEPLLTNDIVLGPDQRAYLIIEEIIPILPTTTVYTDKITIRAVPKTVTNLSAWGSMDYTIIMPIQNRVIYIFATDRVHNATKLDGSENLGDLDVTVYIQLLNEPVSGQVDMYYDVNRQPDGSSNVNPLDRRVIMTKQNGQWAGVIPGNDLDIIHGALVEFIFETDNQVVYRLAAPSYSAFMYVVRSYQYREKGNLLNSILYPLDDSKPQTTLLYELERAGPVFIAVYDMKGDKVRTLVDETKTAGIQPPVVWDGKNDYGQTVGVGIYFIKMQFDDVEEVFKVLVVK
ncbi:MAG: hypothetical protein JW827_10460 [Spirochaetes bacterium]|nr:hypothetical protein [Spirochaetota bacterium]